MLQVGEAEVGSAGEQPTRNNQLELIETISEGVTIKSLPLFVSIDSRMPKKTHAYSI